MNYKPVPRWKQRLGGLLLAIIGCGFWARAWYTALNEGYYYPKASMVFPMFSVVGLGLIIFPGYKEERLARGEDISGLSGMQLITPRWWGVLLVALITGFGNYLILTSM